MGEPRQTRSELPESSGRSSSRLQTWLFHVFSCEAPAIPTATVASLDGFDDVVIGRGDLGPELEVDGGTRRLRLGFPDPWMSTRHARVERRGGEFWVIDAGSKNGVLVNGSRVDAALLADGDWIEAGHTVLRHRRTALPGGPAGSPRPDGGVLRTSLPALQARGRDLEDIARSTVSIMLRGETGTGKEVIARAVHELSGRPGDLVAVNCGALSATLVESELFGYRKGAFSGAAEDRLGLVRAADRGTLFLDEVGDLPLASQAALLRVLQEREVLPVGATRPIGLDLRVISATHRDLEAQAARGEFRPDLYARLSGYTFAIPPLRERREDLGLLTAALLQRIAPDRELRFEPDAVRALCRHDWPLNVRELEKCLASAVVLARDGSIRPEHVPVAVAAPAPAVAPAEARRSERRDQLIAALRAHRGNVSAAARAIGKARSQVQRWIQDLGLDPAHYREP